MSYVIHIRDEMSDMVYYTMMNNERNDGWEQWRCITTSFFPKLFVSIIMPYHVNETDIR